MASSTLDAETAKARLRSELDRAGRTLRFVLRDNAAKVGLFVLLAFIFMGLFGPMLAPHHPIEDTLRQDGSIMRTTPPSTTAPLGTTAFGKDILSQFLAGARATLIVGLLGGLGIGGFGFLVGLTSGSSELRPARASCSISESPLARWSTRNSEPFRSTTELRASIRKSPL